MTNLYGDESSAATSFNLFTDPNVINFLKRYGLSQPEINNFSKLRERQLDYARQNNPQLTWGQSTGRGFKVGPSTNPATPVPNAQGGFPAPMQGATMTPQSGFPVHLSANKIAKLHRAANLIDGMLDQPELASEIRTLPTIASLTFYRGKEGDLATKSMARLAMVIADKIRVNKSPWASKIAQLIEDGIIDASLLGA
jgi:hypothetical protein